MENKERLSPSLSYTLATLLVLIEETDKDHRLSAKAIAEKVKKRLHIDKEESGRIHPHCIQDILAHLGDPEFTLFGKPIDVGPKDNGMGNLGAKRRKGYYLRNRFFSRSEIYTLILALIEAPTLDGDTVCPLVNKLSAYAGPSAPKKVLLDAMVEKVQKRHIPDYWNKIFTLMRACKGKKKVNLGLKGHRPMQASILSLVQRGGYWRFVYGDETKLREAVLDNILFINLTEEEAKPLYAYEGYEEASEEDIGKGLMSYRIEQKKKREEHPVSLIQAVYELTDPKRHPYYGYRVAEVRRYEENGKPYVGIVSDEGCLLYLGMEEGLKLISPEPLVAKLKAKLEGYRKKYGC